MRFVLDSSLTLSWCFADEASEFTRSVLEVIPRTGAVSPELWAYEVANALHVGKIRRRIVETDAQTFVAKMLALPIVRVPQPSITVFNEVRVLADRHSLSAYDAAYLQLAITLGVPLGTLDGSGRRTGLKQAATSCGVEVLSLETVRQWRDL